MENAIDTIQLNFSKESLQLLNICLGIIMFGVALGLRISSFTNVLRHPTKLLVGVACQFLVLPLLTLALIYIIQPQASIALGMLLVAACPGGNISNFMVSFAKGNTALSVSLTAFATIAAVVATPINFAIWGNAYAPASQLLQTISVSPLDMVQAVVVLLGIPLALGLTVAEKLPTVAEKIVVPIRYLSIVIFAGFIAFALVANADYFKQYIFVVAGIVFIHNAIALSSGFVIAKLILKNTTDARAIAIETGIQNSGLGLVLIFNFFNGLGGMAIIAAWWGVWHIISGLTIATFWRYRQ